MNISFLNMYKYTQLIYIIHSIHSIHSSLKLNNFNFKETKYILSHNLFIFSLKTK